MKVELEKKMRSMRVGDLRKEISKTNVKGYSKLKKEDIINLMLKYPKRFMYLVGKEEKMQKLEKMNILKSTKVAKPEPKKEEPSTKVAKPEPKKEKQKVKKTPKKPAPEKTALKNVVSDIMENMEKKKELSPSMKAMIDDIKEGDSIMKPPARYYFQNRADFEKRDLKLWKEKGEGDFIREENKYINNKSKDILSDLLPKIAKDKQTEFLQKVINIPSKYLVKAGQKMDREIFLKRINDMINEIFNLFEETKKKKQVEKKQKIKKEQQKKKNTKKKKKRKEKKKGEKKEKKYKKNYLICPQKEGLKLEFRLEK